MEKIVIELKNATKKNKKNFIFKNFNFRIQENDHIAFVGLNGSGKTTLAEIILKLRKLNQGKIIYYSTFKKNAVFQESSFNSILNLEELVFFYHSLHKIKINKIKVNQLFRDYNLENKNKSKFKNLSGGEKQKFKLLIALINNPNLLILDEITNNLDFQWKTSIINFLQKRVLNKPTTLILISHNKEEITNLTTKILYFQKNENPKFISLPQFLSFQKKMTSF